MKKVLSITALIAFAGMVIVQPALAGKFGKTQFRQDKRICQGINSGELTQGEARYLGKQQNRIQKHKRLASADGTVTGIERNRLERHQNRANADIYRLKHNNWDQN
jgi:hypothetical protein